MEENINNNMEEEKERLNADASPEHPQSGSSRKEEITEQKDELTICKEERDEYLNGWKRAKADLINYKKEEARRLEEIVKFSTSDLVEDIIPVFDSFDLAITTLEKDTHAEKGIHMIRAQLEDTLKKRGLETVKTKAGDVFDPTMHESVGEIDSEHPPGTIAQEIERGYKLHGRVVRAARVKLSKEKTIDN